jgi:hypothetical protein
MGTALAASIPLVCSHRPPGAPLGERVAYLTAQARQPDGAGHRDNVARAAGVFNFAALIASDSGVPELATALCWQQHDIFASAGALAPDIAVIALMPLVNIARQQARQGDGNAAYRTLNCLYRAAQQRGTATVAGHRVNLAPLTCGPAHLETCRELWAVLLTDGARALAREGRWTDAAKTMAAHHGIGTRLLDGRQIKIMSLLEQGHHREAASVIDATIPAQPWEAAVAAILRAYCQQQAIPAMPVDPGDAITKTIELIGHAEPTTAAFRSRTGLAALDLAASQPQAGTAHLHDAIVKVAATDAYAARNALSHPIMRARMTCHQERQLTSIVTAAGLGAGHLPADHIDTITSAVGRAEEHLRVLLRPATLYRSDIELRSQSWGYAAQRYSLISPAPRVFGGWIAGRKLEATRPGPSQA